MKKITYPISAALVALMSLGPIAASAALLDGSANVNSAVGATVNSATKAISNSAANANVTSDISGTVNTDSNINSNTDLQTNTGVNLNLGVESNGVVSLDRSNSNSDKSDASAVVSVRSADTVSTTADLKTYAAGNFQSDENLQNMSFASDKVEVGYNQHGRFLGFIPVTMNVTTDVDANGNVSTHYPWYNFLVASDRASLDAQLKTRISNILAARSDASATLSVKEQARIAAEVYAVMKGRFENNLNGAVNAQAHASDNAKANANENSALNATTSVNR